VGNLSAHDPSPLRPEDWTPLARDASALAVATAMTQALVGQLFALPSEAVQGGRLAHLPAPSSALPREKPIPKPKPLTKWQKFAQVRVAVVAWPGAARVRWLGAEAGVGCLPAVDTRHP
jgi:regulator of ribosome biosynthesis